MDGSQAKSRSLALLPTCYFRRGFQLNEWLESVNKLVGYVLNKIIHTYIHTSTIQIVHLDLRIILCKLISELNFNLRILRY